VNTAIYYVCVVNDKYTGPKQNIGKFMGDYDFITSPKHAALFTSKEIAEARVKNMPYLSVIPLTMSW